MAMAATEPIELCPRCVARPIEHEDTGWCLQCAETAALEKYRDRNDREIARLRRNWQRRTKKAFSDAPAALAERQQWHRLLEKTKPRQAADPYGNPLQLAFDALQELNHVKAAIRSNSRARDHIERVEEAIRQLAWGPRSVPSPPKARPKVSPGKLGMPGSPVSPCCSASLLTSAPPSLTDSSEGERGQRDEYGEHR
jgi:hypothetical protein